MLQYALNDTRGAPVPFGPFGVVRSRVALTHIKKIPSLGCAFALADGRPGAGVILLSVRASVAIRREVRAFTGGSGLSRLGLCRALGAVIVGSQHALRSIPRALSLRRWRSWTIGADQTLARITGDATSGQFTGMNLFIPGEWPAPSVPLPKCQAFPQGKRSHAQARALALAEHGEHFPRTTLYTRSARPKAAQGEARSSAVHGSGKGAEVPSLPGGEALGRLGSRPKAGPWPERIMGATQRGRCPGQGEAGRAAMP